MDDDPGHGNGDDRTHGTDANDANDGTGPAATSPSPFEAGSPSEGHWTALLEDAAATAAVYREEGWETLELRPTDATALTDGGTFGLAVTVPRAAFDRLDSWVTEGGFGEYEVYRAETGRVFLLVVARDERNRRVVCVPAHYDFESVPALADRAEAEGRFLTHVLGPGGERLTFTHDDPGPFFPGGGTDPEEEEERADGADGAGPDGG